MLPLRIRYQTLEFKGVDIHLRTLRDLQQFGVDESTAVDGMPLASWPLFGVVWESSEVLAHFLDDYDTESKRVLEVGCGIGLASLLLNSRHADVTATDYHPEVQHFLEENVRLNGGRPIPFVRTDWAHQCPALGTFDLIVGSDLLYAPEMVEPLSTFINRHATRHCEVLIVDPGRGLDMQFSSRMERVGYTSTYITPGNTEYLLNPFRGRILQYRR